MSIIEPTTPQQAKPFHPAFLHDVEIISRWKIGFNTAEIAKRLHVPESEISNRLARLRDAGAV